MMKKIVVISIIALFALGAFGQSKTLLSEFGYTSDTVTNTGTVYMSVGATFSSINTLSVSAKSVNVSGTTAGTAVLQHSINGSDFVTHPTADTLTLSDGAVHIWTVDSDVIKYRVKLTGTGTGVSIVSGNYVHKK